MSYKKAALTPLQSHLKVLKIEEGHISVPIDGYGIATVRDGEVSSFCILELEVLRVSRSSNAGK